MSCDGLVSDWACAGPAGAAASGASAQAAVSMDFRRRLFIILPLNLIPNALLSSIVVVVCLAHGVRPAAMPVATTPPALRIEVAWRLSRPCAEEGRPPAGSSTV